MVGYAEYPGSRLWLPLKRQEVMDYRKARQERKCERSISETDIRITIKGEASKSGDKLTRVSRRICQ